MGCGYVLRPEYMFQSNYSPLEPSTISSDLTIILGVQVMAARYLSRKSGRGILFSPYVEVEICGADYDNAKFKTKSVNDNGFNPDWNESFDFQISYPDLAMLRFVIYDVDIFGDSNFIGQYTVPVPCIRHGYRSIPLKNAYSEDLELAALLVRLQVTEKSKTNGKKLTELRESAHKLLKQSEMSEAMGDSDAALRFHEEAQKKEMEVMNLLKQ